jgi:hypothetical protein
MAVASGTRGVMTLSDLQASKEYLACSAKMRVFLTTLIENGFDYPAATAAGFNCKNPRVFSYAVRNWAKVRAALNLYLGHSEQDIFLDELQQTIRRAPKGSDRHVRALALYARMRFGVDTSGSDDSTGPVAATSKSETPRPGRDVRVPAGATPLADDVGVIRGYRLPSGDYVRLVDGAAEVHVRE